jgi:hypothetical protein
MSFGAASGSNNIGRNVSNDYLTLFGGSNVFPGAAISMSGTNRTTYGGMTYFYSTNALGQQIEAMKMTGNTNAPALTMVNADINMTAHAILQAATIQSSDTGLISIHGGSTSGAAINMYGKSAASFPGNMYFYATDNVGGYYQALLLQGNLATPYFSSSVPWYFNGQPLYSVGGVVFNGITAISRDVDNSYFNIYGGTGGKGSAITMNGPSSSYQPGALNFWTTNAAGDTAGMAHFTGATNTPVLDMESHRISAVANATTTGDALNYNAWQAWTPTITWGGTPPASLTTTARWTQVGKIVYFHFLTGSTDSNAATSMSFSLPKAARYATGSDIFALSGGEYYVNSVPANVFVALAPVIQSGGEVTYGYVTPVDGKTIQIWISGFYEVA